jgi:hypothetical protein
MNSYRRDSVDPRTLSLNQEIAEQHVDDLYNIRFLPAGVFVPIGTTRGTAGQSSGIAKWGTIDYPTTYASATIMRPAYWLLGNFKVTVLYTSQTAGAANFGLLATIGAVSRGANLSDTGDVVIRALTANIPGPTAADDEKEHVYYTSTAQVSQAHRLIYIRIGRDGLGDANNSIMQLVGVIVEFIPARANL